MGGGLAARAEVQKLGRVLGTDEAALGFLQGVAAADLRALRHTLYEELYALDRRLFQRLARWFGWLPAWIGAWIARLAGPLLTARFAGDLPARRAARMAQRLPAPFLADVCPHLDPRCAHDLIEALPVPTIVGIALELLRRRDWITMGRFVDFLSDDAIRAVLEQFTDDEVLLRVAFYVESRERLDHVLRLLPRERLRTAILLALDESRDILREVMSLIINVSYGLKRELGDLAAAQDERVLERVVCAAQAEGLWTELLPAITTLSVEAQRKVVNLPVLCRDLVVLETIVRTAHEHSLWNDVLPLVRHMDEPMRDAVAGIASGLPPGALAGPAEAALLGEQWEALLDLATRTTPDKQRELARIVRGYGQVDGELQARIEQRARALGMAESFGAEAMAA